MKRFIIFTDMDEVIVQLMKSWLALYNRDYDDDKQPWDMIGWNVERWVKPECGKKMYDYLSLPNFFFDLEPYDGAVEGMRELHAKHDLFILTATPLEATRGLNDKMRWVKHHLPFFETNRIISCHHKQLLNGDILLDDGAHNLADFRGIAIKMDRPGNIGEDDCCDGVVEDWRQFVDVVHDLANHEKYYDYMVGLSRERLEKIDA